MLLTLSEVFETPVSTLLGETVMETPADPLRAISEKLEVINLQLAKRKNAKEKILFWLLISFCAVTAVLAVGLYFLKSPYLGCNLSNPEFAVLATAFHVDRKSVV